MLAGLAVVTFVETLGKLATSLVVSNCTARGVSSPDTMVQEVVPQGTEWEDTSVLNSIKYLFF